MDIPPSYLYIIFVYEIFGGIIMNIINRNKFRQNMSGECDKAVEGEVIYITGPKGKNVVMISEEKFNELMKGINNE